MWMWLQRQLHYRLFSNNFSWKDTSSDLGARQTLYWQPQQDVKTNTQIRQGKERDSHSLSFKRSHICMENVMPKWVNNSMQWINMREIKVKLLYERSGVEVEKYQKLFTEILKGILKQLMVSRYWITTDHRQKKTAEMEDFTWNLNAQGSVAMLQILELWHPLDNSLKNLGFKKYFSLWNKKPQVMEGILEQSRLYCRARATNQTSWGFTINT